jgi:hypothetical protein
MTKPTKFVNACYSLEELAHRWQVAPEWLEGKLASADVPRIDIFGLVRFPKDEIHVYERLSFRRGITPYELRTRNNARILNEQTSSGSTGDYCGIQIGPEHERPIT